MVLEDVNNSTADESSNFNDDSFNSDTSVVSVHFPAGMYPVDWSRVPKPLAFGRLLRIDRSTVAKITTLRAVRNSTILGRPVTRAEFQAQVYHDGWSVRKSTQGALAGALFGIARAYQTRDTWRFPLWRVDYKPDGTGRFNPYKLGPLVGNSAALVWRILRGTTYTFLGTLMGFIAMTMAAQSIQQMRSLQDPQLRAIPEALRATPRELRAVLQKDLERVPDMDFIRQIFKDGPSPDGAPARPGYYAKMRLAQSSARATPSATATAWPNAATPSSQQSTPDRRAQHNSPAPQQPQRGFFDVDDASPTAGAPPEDDKSAPQSAWERLRSQAPSPNTQPVTAQRPPGHAQGDAWARMRNPDLPDVDTQNAAVRENRAAFAQQDRDQLSSRAQEQRDFNERVQRDRLGTRVDEQREFDERVERERQGLDFDEGSRRW